MKALLTIEDTPQGVRCKAYWGSNDCTDKPDESVSMMVMANLTETIKLMARNGAVKLEKEEAHDQ
jgi:hypothetical protein